MFSLFGAVLGLSWGPCWPHFRSLMAILGAFWAILGLARAGQGSQVKLNQVKAGQDHFEDPPGSGTRPGLGREGFPGHIRMGPALENPSNSKRILRASWVHIWRSCSVLGTSWGGLGPSWALLGQPRDVLKTSWGRLGGVLGAKAQTERGGSLFRTDFRIDFGGVLARLGCPWAGLGRYVCFSWGVSGVSSEKTCKTFNV